MPYYKRKAATRKFTRKPYRKRMMRRRPHNQPVRVRSQPGITDRAMVKMKYRDNYVLSASAPNYQKQWTWRLNSIYDVDKTGTGHQPLCYDQWNLFYLSYRVYKVDVEINLVNNGTAPTQVLWTVQPDDPVVDGTDATFEQPHTYSKILGGNTSQNRATIRRSMYLPKYLGLSPTQYKASENTYALFGSNPNTSIYGILLAETIDNSSQPNICANVTIIFHCEFFDRKELGISETNTQLKAINDQYLLALKDEQETLGMPAIVQ